MQHFPDPFIWQTVDSLGSNTVYNKSIGWFLNTNLSTQLCPGPRGAMEEVTEPILAFSEAKVTQPCPTLCESMDCSPRNSPGQNIGVGSSSLLQGIFPTQGLNPGLPHCRQILYQLSHKGSPRILECLSLLQRILLTRESNWGLLHCRWILYQLSYQVSPKPC